MGYNNGYDWLIAAAVSSLYRLDGLAVHILAYPRRRSYGYLWVFLLLFSENGTIYEFLGYHINVSHKRRSWVIVFSEKWPNMSF